MKPISNATLKKFIALAVEQLSGEWVILGGMVIPLIGSPNRPTLDIDIAPKGEPSNKDRLAVMNIAEKVGLPVEAVNLAAEHFLKKIKDWEKHLVLVKKSKKASIFRPDATLFLLLKVSRLSESDLQDCLEMLKAAKRSAETIDESVLLQINKLKKLVQPADKSARLDTLLTAIHRHSQKV